MSAPNPEPAPAPKATLFLVKSSRVREYHQQNLAIMAAADGETFDISYSRRWVEPGLVVAPGDGACIVFAD